MLPLLYLQALLQQMAAAAQAACSTLLDFTVGSPLLAVMEAFSGCALWLQWLALLLLARTRAATSTGSDLDSWFADFFFMRLAATFATGSVTLSRFSASVQAVVLPGAQVKTGDLSVTFTVTTDTTNPAWNAALGGYVVPIGTTSVRVPVQANTAGTAGNVQGGAISLLASSIPGIDTVTNAVGFSNGLAAETDERFRARFQLYIQALSQGTEAAVQLAAMSVQQNVVVEIVEGAPGSGVFTLYVDDGSGSPPISLVTAVANAVWAVRALSIQPIVLGVTANGVSINVVLALTNTTVATTTSANVATAIATYVNALAPAATLQYLRLAQIIYDADANVSGITTLTVNGGASDIAGAAGVSIKATVLTVS